MKYFAKILIQREVKKETLRTMGEAKKLIIKSYFWDFYPSASMTWVM